MLSLTKGRLALLYAMLMALTGCATEPTRIAGDWRPQIEACPGMAPLLPLASLPSTARLQVEAELRDDRVVRMTVRVLKGIEDRRAQRMALHAVDMALKRGSCPGVQRLSAEALIGPRQAGFQGVRIER